MRRAAFALLALSALPACAVVPPAPLAPRAGTTVAASAGRTWDAVIDVFAERNIPIRTMERVSGFIATDALGLPSEREQQAHRLADCGSMMGVPNFPDRATYNVLVRGDSAAATVKVTVRFTEGGGGTGLAASPLRECTSLGTWETQAEADIRARAEATARGR